MNKKHVNEADSKNVEAVTTEQLIGAFAASIAFTVLNTFSKIPWLGVSIIEISIEELTLFGVGMAVFVALRTMASDNIRRTRSNFFCFELMITGGLIVLMATGFWKFMQWFNPGQNAFLSALEFILVDFVYYFITIIGVFVFSEPLVEKVVLWASDNLPKS